MFCASLHFFWISLRQAPNERARNAGNIRSNENLEMQRGPRTNPDEISYEQRTLNSGTGIRNYGIVPQHPDHPEGGDTRKTRTTSGGCPYLSCIRLERMPLCYRYSDEHGGNDGAHGYNLNPSLYSGKGDFRLTTTPQNRQKSKTGGSKMKGLPSLLAQVNAVVLSPPTARCENRAVFIRQRNYHITTPL